MSISYAYKVYLLKLATILFYILNCILSCRLVMWVNLDHFWDYSSDGEEVSTSWSWLSKKDWTRYIFHQVEFLFLLDISFGWQSTWSWVFCTDLHLMTFRDLALRLYQKFCTKSTLKCTLFAGIAGFLLHLDKINTIELYSCFLCS